MYKVFLDGNIIGSNIMSLIVPVVGQIIFCGNGVYVVASVDIEHNPDNGNVEGISLNVTNM